MATRMKEFTDEDMLREAFRVFDSDGSGTISAEEFKSVMNEFPDAAEESELVDEMIAEIDKDGDGQIDYEGNFNRKYPYNIYQIHFQNRI